MDARSDGSTTSALPRRSCAVHVQPQPLSGYALIDERAQEDTTACAASGRRMRWSQVSRRVGAVDSVTNPPDKEAVEQQGARGTHEPEKHCEGVQDRVRLPDSPGAAILRLHT